jgi:P27 family predicted phage terminase small subunit
MRERKSLAEHKLSGTKPQYVSPDSDVTAGRPKYPKNISGEAKSAYKRLVRMLEQRRALTPGDQEILSLYATVYDRHERAKRKLAQQGDVVVCDVVTKSGEVVQCERLNFYLKIAETCESKMLAHLVQLGLTPGTRGKIKQTEEPKTADDAGAALLSREEAQRQKDAEESDALLNSISDETLEGIQ